MCPRMHAKRDKFCQSHCIKFKLELNKKELSDCYRQANIHTTLTKKLYKIIMFDVIKKM